MTQMIQKRAALYIRVSTQGQVDNGVSLQFQEDELLKYVETNGYTLDKEKHIFRDEGVSGAIEDREGLKAIMKAATRREFDVVLVYKVDRFFRKILQLIQYVEYLNSFDVGFISTTQVNFHVVGSHGKMMLSIFGVLAEMERDLIRERTMEGKRKKAELGYYVGGGKPPFGYKFNKTAKGIKLEVVEDEKRVVNKIFELYTKEKKTLGEISAILERDGELTRDDMLKKTKNGSTKKIHIGRWHLTVLSRILQEEKYIGRYFYGKLKTETNKITKETKLVKSKPEEMVELTCPPLLEDIGLFEKAKELIVKNKITRNTKTGYPLTGLIVCGRCGKHYTGYQRTKGGYSYRCNGKLKHKDGFGTKCLNREVSGEFILNYIWDRIYEIFTSPESAIKEFYNLKKSHTNISKYEKQTQALKNDIKKHNAAIKEALKLQMYGDKATKEIYVELIDEAKNNIQKAEIGISELSQKISSLKDLEYAKNNLNRFKEFYEKKISEITMEKKIEIIRELVQRGTINADGTITILYKFDDMGDDNNGGGDNGDDGDWKLPTKGETTFLDELESDAFYDGQEKIKHSFSALTDSTKILDK